MKHLKSNFLNKHLFLAIILSTIYLLILSILKYNSNGLQFINYDVSFIGNILNILLWFLFISGSIWYIIFSDKKNLQRSKVLILFQLFSIICLILVIILFNYLKIEFSGYFFLIPVRKIILGAFYILSGIFQIYSIVYLWSLVLTSKEYFNIKIIVKSFFAVIILLLFSIAIVLINPLSTHDVNKRYEFALVPGAAVWSKNKPSPIFEGRIKKAHELFKQNTINKIIVIGSNAPGEISEAEAAQKFLLNLGIPNQKIILEPITSTTNEQIKYLHTSKILQKSAREVLVISDSFHLTRITQICKFYNINGIGFSSSHKLTLEKEIFYRTREGVALLLFWMFSI